MPVNVFMSKYQRFVAWRYLMERQPRLSGAVLGFVGICLWLAVGMGAASVWYPMADRYLVPPPNVPVWLVPLLGLACAMPVIALVAALVNALRRVPVRPALLLSIHGSLVACAAFAVFDKSMSVGLTEFEAKATRALFPILVVGTITQINVLRALAEGRHPSGIMRLLATVLCLPALFTSIVAFGSAATLSNTRSLAKRKRRVTFIFLVALQLVAAEVLVLVGAYYGLRKSVWPDFYGELASAGSLATLLWVAVAVGLGGILSFAATRLKDSKGQGTPVLLTIGLAGFAVALGIAIAVHFRAGVDFVGVHLDFIGGWAAYTPPMGFVMPALVAASIAILACVILIARFFFTFFTTVSVGGVTIGTMALVIVLSVMSGFETDLREKILGFNAHIQISRAESVQFEGYREVQAILDKTEGVLGYTPFLTTEAYMSNHNNYGNVTLKGVDPATVASVTEIVHNLEKGDERALEKLWPLEEDGSIAGPPKHDDDGDRDGDGDDLGDVPMDFSGGVEEIDEELLVEPGEDLEEEDLEEDALDGEGADEEGLDDEENDDFELDGPQDFSGGLDSLPDAGPTPDAGPGGEPERREWDVELLPHDYIEPKIAVLDGVLVGRELVKTVNLYTDQEVRVISPLPDTSPDGMSIPRLKNFRVAGRFFSGMYEYDLKYVYCSLHALQDFLDLGDVVNGIEVRVADPRNTAAVVRSLEKALGPEYRVQDWKELNKALFSALKLEKIAMFFILVIIVLVASFSIVGNLIMVVIEKAKEIAILKTLGSSDGGVMKIFITQGFFIGLVGTTLGVALGLGACYLGMTYGVPLDPDVYYIDKLPIQVEGSSVVAVAFAGIAISVVATIYPAFIAARMRPVKGLRWD